MEVPRPNRTFKAPDMTRFADDAGQHRIPTALDLAYREHKVIYTTIDYHLGHCAWVWRRMHRSMGERSYKWPYVWSTPFEHTAHCTEILLDPTIMSEGKGVLDTAFKIAFGGC